MNTKTAKEPVTREGVSEWNNVMRNKAIGDVAAYTGIGALSGVSLAALGALYRRLSDYLGEKKQDKKLTGPVVAIKSPEEEVKVAEEKPTGNDFIRNKNDFGWYWPALIGAPLVAGVASYAGVNALSKWMRKKDFEEKKKNLEQQFQDELALSLGDRNLTLTKGASVQSMPDEEAALLFLDTLKTACETVKPKLVKNAVSWDTILGLLLTALGGAAVGGGVMGYTSAQNSPEQKKIDLIKKRRIITALTTPSAPLVIAGKRTPDEEEDDDNKRDASIPVGAASDSSTPVSPSPAAPQVANVLPMG